MTASAAIDTRLGAAIRLRREALGVTQAALADKIGVTFQQVQKYERGLNRVAASRLVGIALALETSVGELLDETTANDDKPGVDTLVRRFNQIENDAHRKALLDLALSLKPSVAA